MSASGLRKGAIARAVRWRHAPFAAGVAGAAVFLTLHVGNYWSVLRFIASRAPGGTSFHRIGLVPQSVAFGGMMLATYAAFALAGAAIAAKTRDRFLWVLPAFIFVFGPLAGGLVGLGPITPQPIVSYHTIWTWPIWVSSLTDLGLVLLPGAFVAMWGLRAERRADRHDRIAFVLAGAAGFWLYLQGQYRQTGAFDVNVSAHLILLVVFVTGVALGTRRPWFPWVHLAVAYLVSEMPAVVANWAVPLGPNVPSTARQISMVLAAAGPMLLAVGLGAGCEPLAGYLRRRSLRGAEAGVHPA